MYFCYGKPAFFCKYLTCSHRTGRYKDVAEGVPAVDRTEQLPGGAGREAQAVHAHRTPGLQHPADGAHENSQVRDHEMSKGIPS